MKLLRIIMSGLAWVSLVSIPVIVLWLIGLIDWSLKIWQEPYTPYSATDGGASVLWGTLLIIIATIFALSLGFVAKPRYFWIGTLIVGISHILAYSGYYKVHYNEGFNSFWDIFFFGIFIAPGYILFSLGFLLRKGKKNATRRAIN